MNQKAGESVLLFDEFFERGCEEAYSPFLTAPSRRWAKNLELKASFAAALFLLLAFVARLFFESLPFSNLLLVGVYFLAGLPSLIGSIEDLLQGEINIDVLMTLAAFSSVLIGSPMEGGLLLVLFSLSGSMEEAVESKAKGAISALYRLSPTVALSIEPTGEIYARSVQDIAPGTKIQIRAGDIVPLDGRVLKGSSSIDLSHLTGEHLPVPKSVGDEVPAGGQNLEGSLVLEVTRPSSESTIARIIRLVTEAQESKPALQRWFDRISKPYATGVISLTAFFALFLPLLFPMPLMGAEGSLYRAIAFLIAASPCALIIATPTAYLSALSSCARKGIVLKGGVTLDALDSCRAIAFDKTGTLTTGHLDLLSISPLTEGGKLSAPEALSVAFEMEKHAIHPIARAITSYAGKEENLPGASLESFRALPGFGLQAAASLGGESLPAYLGNAEWILPKLDPERAEEASREIRSAARAGDLLALLLLGGELFFFRFSDSLRPEMAKTLSSLKRGRWRLIMLTGDHPDSAQKIAKLVGIEEVWAELKPEDKLRRVGELALEGLIMVGDGINDAPALARATVGVSMGKEGSVAAIEAADVVLLRDNLELLPWLLGKARSTKRIVFQNLLLAASVILLATTPALLGWVPLWLAVTLHEGGTLLVGLNALRLLRN